MSGIEPGPIHYAPSAGFDLAWQEFGSGGRELLFVWGLPNHIESLWRWPSTASFLRGLGSFGRVVHFDQRGTGLSSRVSLDDLPSMEERRADGFAVMDEVGIERAVVLGDNTGAAVALEMAVARPERVEALVLMCPDLAGSLSDELVPVVAELIEHHWGEPMLIDLAFPSLQDDPRYVEWWGEHLRLSATPREARAMFEMDLRLDVTGSAPEVTVPTLVLAQQGDQICPLDVLRGQVEAIPDHRLVVTSGDGHAYGAGPGDHEALEAIAEFLGHEGGMSEPDVVHQAIMFTDIVASTHRLAEIGDHRWRQLIDEHDRVMAEAAAPLGGRIVKSTGDGVLSVFGTARSAIDAVRVAARRLELVGIEIRCGIHAGEIHLRGGDVAGLAVNIAARVVDLASAGQVLVTDSAVHELGDLSLTDLGERDLKGVPGPTRLWAAGLV